VTITAATTIRTTFGIVAVVALGACLATAIAGVELSTFWFSVRLFGMFAALLTIAYLWPRPVVATHTPRLFKWSRIYFGVTAAIYFVWLVWCALQAPRWGGFEAMAVFGTIGIFGWALVGYTIIVVPVWAIAEGVFRVKQAAKGSEQSGR
jgi:hypothetical protein